MDYKIIRKLGAGMFGTTYLCEYRNKLYALKIEHILETDKKKNFNSQMWREINLYEFIDTLSKSDQVFFTKLYRYEIYDNCEHEQKRPMEASKEMKKLDKSNWGIKCLLEYKGNTTLSKYLIKKEEIKIEKVNSICLQLINIILILHRGGYSHNDLHPKNVMITKTDKKYFDLNGKVPYNGIQLSAIDYGEVLSKKFKINYKGWQKDYLRDPEKWLFDEIYYCLLHALSGFENLIENCNPPPWETNPNCYSDGVKLIMRNHGAFFIESSDKYLKLLPKCKKYIDRIYNKRNTNKTIMQMIRNRSGWNVIHRVVDEFSIIYPKLYKKYFSWKTCRKWVIPNSLEFLQLITIDEIIQFFS